MTIPRLQQRLNCMVFRRKVELDIEEVRPDLDIVRSASKELRGSERFRNVLKVIQFSYWSAYELLLNDFGR